MLLRRCFFDFATRDLRDCSKDSTDSGELLRAEEKGLAPTCKAVGDETLRRFRVD